MAYNSVLTAALSGASLRQLAHWRQHHPKTGPVLVPEVSETRPMLYSFRDIVALRTCVFLRREKSLQQVRRALLNLADLGFREHLSEYRIASDGESIVLLLPDEPPVDLLKRPGQGWVVEMADVLRPFKNQRGVEVPDLFRPRRYVEVDEDRRSGYPVIAGTRIPYDTVAGLVKDGVDPAAVSDYFPAVSAAAARDAVSFARYVDGYREPLSVA